MTITHPNRAGTDDGPMGSRHDDPRRRTFTADDKLGVLTGYDAADDGTTRAAILRREGLHSSHIAEWREARDTGALAARDRGAAAGAAHRGAGVTMEGMTSRRPPGVSRETWVDRQVREATERGAFEGLSAAGKPLDPAALTQTAGEWAVEWARREGADMTAALPLSLALRIEREKLVAAVPGSPSEEAVRAAVADFNDRLDTAYRRPQEVPPVALAFVDVERQLARWREANPAPEAAPDGGPAPGGAGAGAGVGSGVGSGRARRWWGARRWGASARRGRP